jgi:hypothetical protein
VTHNRNSMAYSLDSVAHCGDIMALNGAAVTHSGVAKAF